MGSLFDRYTWQARAFPVYITIAPASLGLAAIVPQGLDLPVGAAAAIVFGPLAFLAGQVGADFGKRLEKPLWMKWDGPPTTRFLRHSNAEFNRVTREQVHTKLRHLGLNVPSEKDQQADPHAADEHWEACTEELIRRTRDRRRFPLVFKGLTEYGFRRNLLGLKTFRLAAFHHGFAGMSIGEFGLVGVTKSRLLFAGWFGASVSFIARNLGRLVKRKDSRYFRQSVRSLSTGSRARTGVVNGHNPFSERQQWRLLRDPTQL